MQRVEQQVWAGIPFAETIRQVGEIAAGLGIEAYAVGGVVRDALLGRPTTDLDFVTVGQGSGLRLAKAVGKALGGTTSHEYANFGTAAIRLPKEDLVLEFVGARRESYSRDSRKPVVEDGTLADDQLRRDLTINALAIDLHPSRLGTLIDPFNGLEDLANQIIRTPLAPEQTFSDDPLRMIRAARFAAQLGFTIAPNTFAGMHREAHRIKIVSQERITDELQKMIVAPIPSTGFRLLFEADLLQRIFPELVALKGVEAIDGQRHKDNFFHTLQVLDNLADLTQHRPADETRWLRWAVLLHDIGKPRTKRFTKGIGWSFHGHEEVGARMVSKIFKHLRLPTDDRMRYVEKLVRLHHRPVALVDESVTDSAVRRLLFDAGDDIDDLMTLVRADITSKNPSRVRKYLGAFDTVEAKMVEVEAKDQLRNFQPPVDGNEIMEVLGITAGITIGLLKEAIREAILEGEIPNEHDAAFAFMMARKDDALRRGRLFDTMMAQLVGHERAAMGAIKDALFNKPLPESDTEALAQLHAIKDRIVARRSPQKATNEAG